LLLFLLPRVLLLLLLVVVSVCAILRMLLSRRWQSAPHGVLAPRRQLSLL
jgi:hypothetical protein